MTLLGSALGSDYRIRGSLGRRLDSKDDNGGGGGGGGSSCTKRERDRGKRNCGDNDADGGGGSGGTENQQEDSQSSESQSSESKSEDDKPIALSANNDNLKPNDSGSEDNQPIKGQVSMKERQEYWRKQREQEATKLKSQPSNLEPKGNAYQRLRRSYRSAMDAKNAWEKKQKKKFQQGTTNMLNNYQKKKNEKEARKRRKKGLVDDRLRFPDRPHDVLSNPVDPRAQRKRKEDILRKKRAKDEMDKAMNMLAGTPEEQKAYLESQNMLKRSPQEEEALRKKLEKQQKDRVKKRLEEKAQREKENKRKNKKKVHDKLQEAAPRMKYLARKRSLEALEKVKQKKLSDERIAGFQLQRAIHGDSADNSLPVNQDEDRDEDAIWVLPENP